MKAKFGAALLIAALATSQAEAEAGAGGEQAFKTSCAMCHAVKGNAPPGIGPNLVGVVGRKAGSLAGFAYSPAMQQAGFVWSEAKLKAYIIAPQKLVKGNRMPFLGLADPAAAAAIATYLHGLH